MGVAAVLVPFLVLLPIYVLADEFSAPVVSVLDGDTIEALHNQHAERIRLSGIDCPENGQAFGRRARQAASELVFEKEVTLQTHGKDKYGRTIRSTVKRWTGLPVSIGIAETKTLAKIANRIAKQTPDLGGVFDLLACPDRDSLLNRVTVEEVWGIGRNHGHMLKQSGITSALQLREADDQWIRKRMGVVGLRLVMEFRGGSCLDRNSAPHQSRA